MNSKIQAKGFTAKQELIDFVKEKTEKLFRLFSRTISCEVVLKIDKSCTGDNKVCDIRLVIPGNDLLADARSNTFEEAAMQAIEALERQIHKRKTTILKRSNHKGELK